MPDIYFIHKRKNICKPNKNNHIALNNNYGIAHWNTNNHHEKKFLLHIAKFIDNNQRIRNDYITCWIEYEMPTNYRSLSQGQYIHSIMPVFINSTPPQRRVQNTDSFLFSKDWYYGICNKRSSTVPNLKTDDIVIFGHYDIKNQQIEIYCLFIVKDSFNINLYNYRSLPSLFVYSNLISHRNGRIKFFHVPCHIAKKYTDDPDYFSFVPGRINNNKNRIYYHNPAIININNYNFNFKPNPQRYVYIQKGLNPQNIRNIYNQIKNDILNQRFVLIIDFI